MTSSGDTQPSASADQLKALAHPLRLRILRLCRDRELTNKQLADALGVAPASVLRHVRELVKAGFLAAAPVRTGRRGALERPYRSTGAASTLVVHDVGHNDLSRQVELATVAAHHAELTVAPPGAMRSQLRWTMRLEPAALAELAQRVEAVIADYADRNDPGGVPVNLLWSLHEISRSTAEGLDSTSLASDE